MSGPLSMVIVSHPDDFELVRGFKRQLAPLLRKNALEVWHRGDVLPGEDVGTAECQQVAAADVIVVLLTASFLEDEQCSELVERAVTRHRDSSALVVSILGRDCLWEATPLAEHGVKLLPAGHRAITNSRHWATQDEAWRDVVGALIRVLTLHGEASDLGANGNDHPKVAPRVDDMPPTDDPIKALTRGCEGLTTAYDWRVKEFLREYLGDHDHLIPFGGRDPELGELDAWLERGHEPFALMAAPAGQGKSATLARWCARLVARPGVSVVFVPVSIRFETNLATVTVSLLATQLASLHGEQITLATGASIDEWRGAIIRYLSLVPPLGHQFVVVLDGLDEAAGLPVARLLPRTLPKGVRLLASARLRVGEVDETGWLRDLNWQDRFLVRLLPLPPLSPQGVSEVLISMKVPLDELGQRSDFVTALHRVSKGDPLVVSLYVKRLYERGEQARLLTVADLGAIEPGFKGYVDLWWKDQEQLWGLRTESLKSAARSLLNLLACALGPLSRADAEEMLDAERVPSWSLDEALDSLARFVIGDGVAMGYVFSHPQITSYFYDRLRPTERNFIEQGFLAYGRRTVAKLADGTLKPGGASAYVVQRYGAHLERSDSDPTAFLDLIGEPWKAAWEALEGNQSGYLNDLERAFNATTASDEKSIRAGRVPRFVAVGVRYALSRASVNSRTYNIDPRFAAALLRWGRWTPAQGLAFVRQIHSDARRIEATMFVAPNLPERERSIVIGDLLGMSVGAHEAWGKAIEVVAPHAPRVFFQLLLDAIRKVAPTWLRARLLRVAALRVGERYREEAIAIARSIPDRLPSAWALASLLPHVPTPVQAELLSMMLSRLDGDDPSVVEGEILGLAAAGASEAMLPALIGRGRRARLPEVRAHVLGSVARRTVGEQRESLAQEALAAARRIAHHETRSRSLRELASLCPVHERLAVEHEALRAAESIEDRRSRALELDRNFENANGRSAEIVGELVAELSPGDSPLSLMTLARLGRHLPDREQGVLWARILGEVGGHGDGWEASADLIGKLTPFLPEFAVEAVLSLVREISDPFLHGRVLASIADRLRPDQRDEALDAALQRSQRINDQEWIALTAAWLAPGIPAGAPGELRERLWKLAVAPPASPERQGELVSVFPRLRGSERDEAAETICSYEFTGLMFDTDWEDEDEVSGGRPDVFIAFAPHAPVKWQGTILDVLNGLPDLDARMSALAVVLPHLDPSLRDAVLDDIIDVIDGEEDVDRISLLTQVGRWLTAEMLPVVYGIVARAGDAEDRCRVLVELLKGPALARPPVPLGASLAAARLSLVLPDEPVHRVDGDELYRLTEIIVDLLGADETDGDRRAAVLAVIELAPHLPVNDPILGMTLETVDDLDDVELSAEATIALAGRLSPQECVSALERGLEDLNRIKNRSRGAELIELVEPRLHSAVLVSALWHLDAIHDPDAAVGVVVSLLPNLHGEEREHVLARGLELARSLTDPGQRASALSKIVPSVAEAARPVVVVETLGLACGAEEVGRADVLVALAPWLAVGDVKEALLLALRLRDSARRDRLLVALAPRLNPEQIAHVTDTLWESERPLRGALLAGLGVERLPPGKLHQVARDLIAEMSRATRDEALEMLKPFCQVLDALAGPTAVGEVATALMDIVRWWP